MGWVWKPRSQGGVRTVRRTHGRSKRSAVVFLTVDTEAWRGSTVQRGFISVRPRTAAISSLVRGGPALMLPSCLASFRISRWANALTNQA